MGWGGDGKVIVHLAVVSEMYGNLDPDLQQEGDKSCIAELLFCDNYIYLIR